MTGYTSTRVLFRSSSFVLGEFRCTPEDPKWVRRSCASVPFIAIPRTFSVITQEGRGAVVATPNEAIFYNAGCDYTCSILSPAREVTTYLDIASDVLVEAISKHDPSVEERPDAPLNLLACTTRATTYFRYIALSIGGPGALLDGLSAEENMCVALDAVLADAYSPQERRWRAPRLRDPMRLDHARHVQEFLATRFRDPLSLEDIAARVGVTTYHLCRVFRDATGITINAYRNALRLRASVEELADERASLANLALGLGYCSQSHFTSAFRRCFGTSPGRVRHALRRFGTRDGPGSLLRRRP